jgi:hypothetical protein
MNKELTLAPETPLYDAVETAIANFLGNDDFDERVTEVVATRVAQALDLVAEYGFIGARFDTILESTSTYVLTDLSKDELADWVGELETQLEEFGLL